MHLVFLSIALYFILEMLKPVRCIELVPVASMHHRHHVLAIRTHQPTAIEAFSGPISYLAEETIQNGQWNEIYRR